MRVRLLHILHYFPLLQPILPSQINNEASNAAAPNIRHARFALRLEPCNVRPANFPADTNGLSCASVYCTYCIFSTPSTHPSTTKNAKASNEVAPNTRPAILPCGLSLAMSRPRAFQPPRTCYHAYMFYCSFSIILRSFIPSPTQKKRRSFKCSRAKHASARLCLAA